MIPPSAVIQGEAMRRNATTLMVLTLVALLGVACGATRKPAVTSAPPPPTTADTGAGRDGTPADTGDDLRPISDEGATGSDLGSSGAGGDGEGGPLSDIRFDYDSAALTDEARAALEKHALWLQTHRDVQVTVEGHCDERGTVDYNLALGEQRARAARDYLVSLGVGAERLRTVSYGKERPLDSGQNDAAWARNRRAHFAVGRR
jgi:peptidoglycan-associated lipoprotein